MTFQKMTDEVDLRMGEFSDMYKRRVINIVETRKLIEILQV